MTPVILAPLVHGDNGGHSFHVVAPSLIDFGFSSASKPGFQVEHHAKLYDRLISELRYDQYVIQAGDVGSIIARYMAKAFGPTRCMALHTNTPLPSEPNKDTHLDLHKQMQETPFTEVELKGLARAGAVSKQGMGYYSMQLTMPTTIGYFLRDSPIGLLAWIYEKLVEWSDEYHWTDEEILTWVSIHYFSTAGPDAPSNLYYAFEHTDPPAFAAAGAYVDVPLGISRFTNDLVLLPKLWNQTLGPIVFQQEHERGGHFAAWEQPLTIVKDLQLMFGDSDIRRKVREKLQATTSI
ncbi:putative epoxide hydrolase [Fusarium oxysporum f. sp. phaseoli]